MRELKLGRRINIHHISQLLKKDFNDVFTKNPIVVITLLAIIILPSLYALINIQACWDPYDNTGNLEFAVANLDKGASMNGEDLNVGDQLEDELKRNEDFYWTFVSEKDLREGVKNGTYYAGIVIPENFSDSIKSITTDNPHSAELEYVVNRKTNPMASKLSDSAARAVYNKINAKIVQFIDVAAYSKLGQLQSSLAAGASQMAAGAGQLGSAASQVQSGASKVKSGAGDLSKGSSQLKSGAGDLKDGASKVNKGASQVTDGASQVKAGSSQISSSADQVSAGSSKIQDSAKQLDQSVDENMLPDQLKPVVHGSKELANASSDLAGASSNLAKGSSKLANSSADVAKGASDVAGGASSLADGASGLADGASQLADGSNQLAEGSVSLAAGSAALADGASSALFSASSGLAGAAGSLSGLTGVDEDQVGDYMYAPVKLKENELYTVPDYGSEVAPFYLVLSMW